MKKIRNLLNPYFIIIALSILVPVFVLKLWQADIRVPFWMSADSLYNLMSIKTVLDNGWCLHNQFLGAPFGLDFYDFFPTSDNFNFIFLKLIGLFSDSAVALNLFFIATFPVIAITSFLVLRTLKVSSSVSTVISLLYTFLPYHFLRGTNHLFLSAYFTVPPIALIILSLWDKNLPLISSDRNSQITFKSYKINAKSLAYILICIILGASGVYYAFFSCFFIAVASLSAFICSKNKQVFLSAILLITLISGSVFLNILPSLVYNYQREVNQEVAQRNPSDSELFGLKTVHLLLPIKNHRFPVLRNLREDYEKAKPPLQNENTIASLGIIGSIGFLSLLFRTIFLNSSSCLYNRLAVLNISALLFSTIGGFSSIFALIVSPQIRGTNRISVFIGFFSLLAVALFLDSVRKKYADNNKRNKLIFNGFLSFILLLGIFDQTSSTFTPSYSLTKQEYISDRNFVRAIEESIPTGSMVFQLPYVPFPENLAFERMKDYELFRPYLHSKNLKWSYGAMKGRLSNWHQLISEQPLDILLSKISLVGFNGIYIDRNGYADSGKQIETELEKQLGTKPLVNENGRTVFFNMSQFNEKFDEEFRSRYNDKQIEKYKYSLLNPIELTWKDGFYGLEKNLEKNWRWSDKKGTLILNNLTSKARTVQISMSLASGWADYSNLRIESEFFSEKFKINSTPLVFSQKILLPPGKHAIAFFSDAKRINSPTDPRRLSFQVIDFKLREDGELLP